MLASALAGMSPAVAHHSVAMFDSNRQIVLVGTVTRMEWTNPHVWIRVDVPDGEGNVVEWSVEASNPLDLGRKGWSRSTFKADDKVTITVHPAKNDRPFGSFIRAVLPDGTTLGEPEETGKESGDEDD